MSLEFHSYLWWLLPIGIILAAYVVYWYRKGKGSMDKFIYGFFALMGAIFVFLISTIILMGAEYYDKTHP